MAPITPSPADSFNQETLARIEGNDAALRVLRISDISTPNPNHGDVGMYVPSDDAEFAKLGDAIGYNTCLESVCFDGDRGLEVVIAAFASGIKRNTSIDRLSLCRCDLSEGGAGRNILKAFGGRTLVSVSLQRCMLGFGGMRALSETLGTCTGVKCIRLTECRGNLRLHQGSGLLLNYVVDESMEELVAALTRHDLHELDLGHNDIIGAESCKVLSTLLKDPRCNVNTLRLENNLVGSDSAAILADVLVHNKKLRNLYLHGNPIFGRLKDAFSRVLCNTTTINDTYVSNHTLRSFVSFRNWSPPAFLELNQSGTDTREVATKKILRYHRHIDMRPFFEWDLKVLPIALAWIEKARLCTEDSEDLDRRQWSALYQFAVALPEMFVTTEGQRREETRMASLLERLPTCDDSSCGV